MRIRIRHHNYHAIKQIAHNNMVTINALVDQIIRHRFDLTEPKDDEFNDAYLATRDIIEAGKILNNYTKQINANIKTRKEIDDVFFDMLSEVMREAIIKYSVWRNQNFNEFFFDFTLNREGDFNKINNRKLTPNLWQMLTLNLDTNATIRVDYYCSKFRSSSNKIINSLISLFLNQGCFFDKETKELCGYLRKSLSTIKVNSNQIYHNKKKNATLNEILISDKIRQLCGEKIDQLGNDQILFSGRKFSNQRLKETINRLKTQ